MGEKRMVVLWLSGSRTRTNEGTDRKVHSEPGQTGHEVLLREVSAIERMIAKGAQAVGGRDHPRKGLLEIRIAAAKEANRPAWSLEEARTQSLACSLARWLANTQPPPSGPSPSALFNFQLNL
jgi:hypothetical protein